MQGSDNSSPQSRLREMLNQPVGIQPIESILSKIQIELITGLQQLVPPAYDFSELDRIFGRFQKNHISTKSEYARLILDIVIYFIKTMKNVSINREDYMRLEEETQDIESKIRMHIKNENKLRLEFDLKERMIQKLREENVKLREESRSLKATISDLQKRLHQQLKIFVSKIGKNPMKTMKSQLFEEKITPIQRKHIKDPGEKPSKITPHVETDVTYQYKEGFNNPYLDRAKCQLRDRHRSLE